MRKVAEIYMVSCSCGAESKVTVIANDIVESFFSKEDDDIPPLPIDYPLDSFECWNCHKEVYVPYKIICIGYQTWNQSMKNELVESSQILDKLSRLMKLEEYK